VSATGLGYKLLRTLQCGKCKNLQGYSALNTSWTISVVSPWEAANFHFATASAAASTRTGFPPRTRVLLTLPFGRTMASTRTTPWMCIFFANSGYAGVTRVATLRSEEAEAELS